MTFVAEAGPHNLSWVIELLIVVVNLANGFYAWIVVALVVLSGIFFVPVVDAADEGRNQFGASFCANDGLREGEEKGHIAVNAFFLKDLCGFGALPGGG